MTEPVSFRIKAQAGHIVPESPKALRAYLLAHEGKEFRMELPPWVDKRSNRQNRAWFGLVVKPFCEHMGYRFNLERDKEFVHEQILIAIGHRELVQGFGGQVHERALPTRDLDREKFWELYEAAQELGATMDIIIPDPKSPQVRAIVGDEEE